MLAHLRGVRPILEMEVRGRRARRPVCKANGGLQGHRWSESERSAPTKQKEPLESSLTWSEAPLLCCVPIMSLRGQGGRRAGGAEHPCGVNYGWPRNFYTSVVSSCSVVRLVSSACEEQSNTSS